MHGSGFTIEKINFFTLKVFRRRTMSGTSFQELPKFLKNKRCIVNVKNTDNRCFGYAICSARFPKEVHPERPTNYTPEMFTELGLDHIDYPVDITKLEEIEHQLQIPFNVFRYYDDLGKARYPLYMSKLDPLQEQNPIDLIYFKEHFAWIKNWD